MFSASRNRLKSRSFRGAIIVIAILAVCWLGRKWTEPRYLGRGIRSWLEQLPYDTASNSESNEALDSFGSKAVPYLIEAAERPLKWDQGLLTRIPRNYLEPVIDVNHQFALRNVALGRLEELAREEIERAELEPDPKLPITTQLVALWRFELAHFAPDKFYRNLSILGPCAKRLSPELKQLWMQLSPATNEWQWGEVTRALGETRDPTLIPQLLKFADPTHSDSTRANAIAALARIRPSNEEVARTVRVALASTNSLVLRASLRASAHLGTSLSQALVRIGELKNEAGASVDALRFCDLVEPILRWRLMPDSPEAIAAVDQLLAPTARIDRRFHVPAYLASAGAEARCFLPSLARMAHEPGLWMRSNTIRAIREIDPEAVREIVKTIPPQARAVRARTAGSVR